LVEEMMQPDSRAAVLILDPHGEYGSLEEMEDADLSDKFQDGDGYSPEVQIKRPDDIQIRISELSLGDLFSIIDDPSDPQEQVLAEAWNQLQSESDDYISINNIQEKVEEVGDEKDLESSARALDWRIDKALDRDLFDHSNHLSLPELLEPGQCTVLQLDTMDLRDQQMLVSVLFRKINQERVAHEKGRESELEFPVFGLLEEGHRFAPADGNARSLPVLSTILSEGRKFGVGIGIISQRPSKIDDDVLSQCKTQIIMQIQNPLDQDAVKKGVEDVGEDMLSELPGLTPGQAIIAGDSVNTPFLTRIRERHTKHDAESLEATKLWQQNWKEQQRQPDGVAETEEEEGVEDRSQPLD
jgi:DNA helicase HerA-like ATPase